MALNSSWNPFDGGATLGTLGSEQGLIVADEEYDATARITLERDGRVAPWSITCGVYGRMMHTVFIGIEADAHFAYQAMKTGLAAIVELSCESEASASRSEKVIAAIEKLVSDFP